MQRQQYSESAEATKPDPHTSCLHAWTSGAVSGCLAGLVGGMVWGIVQEKKFIFRNMLKVMLPCLRCMCLSNRASPQDNK